MRNLFPSRRSNLVQTFVWSGLIAMMWSILCAAAVAGEAGLDGLVGSWVRPDGGYKLVVKSVAEDGAAKVEYFNPSPIKVAVAKAAMKDGKATLFVEFDDVNYEGSKYDLTLSPDQKQLVGNYFQAASKETYAIFFDRLP